MCFTFLAALGHDVGASHLESSLLDEARSIIEAFPQIELPTDFIATKDGALCTTGIDVPEGWQGVDIGPESREQFASTITDANTVLWNGPMGIFEDDRFAAGTEAVAKAIAACDGYTVAGGGDTAAALSRFGLEDRLSHLSSGGGATLELLEYGDLPGLAALRRGMEIGLNELAPVP
jgi:phosphoglycerate kinase